MTYLSNSSQSTSTRPIGKNYSSFLDFTHNYEGTSGIFVPCTVFSWLQHGGCYFQIYPNNLDWFRALELISKDQFEVLKLLFKLELQ